MGSLPTAAAARAGLAQLGWPMASRPLAAHGMTRARQRALGAYDMWSLCRGMASARGAAWRSTAQW
jgi:hypothetical protein